MRVPISTRSDPQSEGFWIFPAVERGQSTAAWAAIPAEPAADTLVVNEGHRVGLELVAVGANGQGRAGGNPDAGMIPGTGMHSKSESTPKRVRTNRLPCWSILRWAGVFNGQHAFTLGDDDFQPLGAGVQSNLPEHFHPFPGWSLERGDHVHSRRLEKFDDGRWTCAEIYRWRRWMDCRFSLNEIGLHSAITTIFPLFQQLENHDNND